MFIVKIFTLHEAWVSRKSFLVAVEMLRFLKRFRLSCFYVYCCNYKTRFATAAIFVVRRSVEEEIAFRIMFQWKRGEVTLLLLHPEVLSIAVVEVRVTVETKIYICSIHQLLVIDKNDVASFAKSKNRTLNIY